MLIIVISLGLAAVLVVAAGSRWGLPWPVLMVVLTAGAAFIPGLPRVQIEPDLILPLLLPPLLWAVARRGSWSMYRSQWRAILTLAVLLVLATVAAVAGMALLLTAGISVAAAVALGAVVAPPDPVAVEAVAGSMGMPRRVLGVLQTEGLFNDAVSLVVFQLAVQATTGTSSTNALTVVGRFGYEVVAAAAIGFAVAFLARQILSRVADVAASAALTLIIPFAVYIVADQVKASGVIAVVVAALALGQAPADQAVERVVGASFWRVIELLITGIAFGLIGLQLPAVVSAAGNRLGLMVGHGLLIAVVIIALRMAWMVLFRVRVRRLDDCDGAPRTLREAVVMAWGGMRGLVTLALALSLPLVGFPARTEVTVIAVVVLVVTLVGQGLTLPWLVRTLGVASQGEVENAADTALSSRARSAALAAIRAEVRSDPDSDSIGNQLITRIADAKDAAADDPDETHQARLRDWRAKSQEWKRLQAVGLTAARQELLSARTEPGVDPESVDRIVQGLDVRSLLA